MASLKVGMSQTKNALVRRKTNEELVRPKASLPVFTHL